MRDGQYWEEIHQRLDTLRGEADTRQQLRRAGASNLWAQLLPPLRRLEGWMERHAGTPAGSGAVGRRAAAR